MTYLHDQETDITIVGGGVAGCIAAIALAPFYRVLLIDKLEQPQERVGECLAPAARRILKKLDLLAGMEYLSPSSTDRLHLVHSGTRSYWGSEEAYLSDHLRNPDGFGWHLDRKAFESYLRVSAAQRGVQCLWGTRLQESDYEDPYWHLKLVSEKKESCSVQSRFVIDASGRPCYFARYAGAEREHYDNLISIWATMPDREANSMALISADQQGWWYSASLPRGERVLALQTDADLIDRAFVRKADSFTELAKLNRVMAEIIGDRGAEISFKGSVAANSSRLKQVCGSRWAALGDAATSFDPLSSQGMFNAMASAMQLSELLQKLNVVQSHDHSAIKDFQSLYTLQINRIWDQYLQHKKFFYAQEERWKEAEFWKRRQLSHPR